MNKLHVFLSADKKVDLFVRFFFFVRKTDKKTTVFIRMSDQLLFCGIFFVDSFSKCCEYNERICINRT